MAGKRPRGATAAQGGPAHGYHRAAASDNRLPPHPHRAGGPGRLLGQDEIREVLTAPHSRWQNPFAERLIGSIRRECLDHVLVLHEQHLRRILARYYHRTRTHLSL